METTNARDGNKAAWDVATMLLETDARRKMVVGEAVPAGLEALTGGSSDEAVDARVRRGAE